MYSADEYEKRILIRASENRIPIYASMELLPLCNMNCDMCYVRLSREEMERQGRLRTAEEWIAVARQMRDAGTLFLLLTGGEPLIYPDFKRLYLALRDMGFLITINTNGTLIDEEWAGFFGAHKPRRINVTLYGADEQAYEKLCHFPGGFSRTVNGIKLLGEQGVAVKMSVSITRSNVDNLEQLMKIGAELAVPVQVDTYMVAAERERGVPFNHQSRLLPEEAAETACRAKEIELGWQGYLEYAAKKLFEVINFRLLPEKTSCLAGKCSFAINWQGFMRPCVMQIEPSIDVFADGINGAWKKVVDITERRNMNAKCKTCSIRLLCRTCAASALLETGSYDGVPEYMCRYTKETYRQLAGFCMHEMQRRRRNGEEAEDGKE